MKILHYLDAVLVRLSVIPGLGFLHEYVHELETQQARRRQIADMYRGYGRALRDSVKEVGEGGHGDHEGHGKHEKHAGAGKHDKHGKGAARPGRGGQVARSSQDKVDDPSDLEEDYYEDDDFESYLQH